MASKMHWLIEIQKLMDFVMQMETKMLMMI